MSAPCARAFDAAETGARLARRVAALEALFVDVAATRMQGIPILHPALAVKALGFEATPDGRRAGGVLVTPWFMNLVWLPLGDDADEPPLRVGATRTRRFGNESFDFIGAFEPGFGAYEACSLFSPMSDFVDQAAALATAEQVLRLLRQPRPEPSPEAAAPAPSRRDWLFGRGALPGGSR
jgi:[NiFe] hydrogenase assembly HybE family chaperone